MAAMPAPNSFQRKRRGVDVPMSAPFLFVILFMRSQPFANCQDDRGSDSFNPPLMKPRVSAST
jgi:hypothetical protein